MDLAELGMLVDSRPLDRASGSMDRFVRTGRQTEAQVRRVERATDSLGGSLRSVAKYMAGLGAASLAASSLFRASQSYQNMANSLRGMGLSADQAASALGDVTSIANRTRAPLEATAQLYRRISVAAGELGASQSQVLRFTENVGLALAASGTSANEASGSLLQLSQAMAGGVVRAEEFNSILEGAFPIAQAAARGIDEAGGSVGRLRQLVVEGKISSDEFFNAILSQTDQLQAAFANTVPTIGQALTVLGNNFTSLVGSMDQTLGVSSAVAQGILALSENLDRVAIYAGTAAVVLGGAYAGSVALAAARTLTFSGALVVLRGAMIRTGIGALIVGAGELVFQFSRMVKATGSFGGALSLLGDVAIEVWNRIRRGASIMGEAISFVALGIKGYFLDAFASIAKGFSSLTSSIASGINSLLGTELSGLGSGLAESLSSDAASHIEAAKLGLSELEGELLGLSAPLQSLEALNQTAQETTQVFGSGAGAADRLNQELGKIGGSSGGAGRAGKAIEKALSEAEAFDKALRDAAHSAEDFGREKAGVLVSGIDGVSRAWGDWMASGLSDFRGFANSILDSFKGMLSEMIALAARNRIMIALGIGGVSGGAAAAGGVANAASGGGGILSSILGIGGGGGGGLSTVLGGLTNVFSGGILSGIGGSFSALGGLLTGGGGGLTAIGAAIPAVGLIAGAISLFVGKTKELDRGLQVTVGNMGTLVETFQRIEKSRLFGLIKSRKTKVRAASADVADPIIEAISGIQSNVMDAAAELGIASSAFSSFATSIRVSTKGLSDEQAAEAVQRELLKISDGMASMALAGHSVVHAGESATDALTRLSISLSAVNTVLDTLGHTVMTMSIEGGASASDLADLFGGLDAFSNATTAYFQAFYSEAERVEIATRQATAALSDYGLALPRSREQYRSMVEALDLTTQSGRELYATLVGMSSVMNEILPSVAAFTAQIASLVGQVSTGVDAMITEVTASQRASEAAASLWERTSRTLRSFLSDLRGTASAIISPQAARTFNQRQFTTLLASAMAGDNQAATDLPDAARALLESARETSATKIELKRIEGRVLAGINSVAGVSDIEDARHQAVTNLLGQQITLLTQVRNRLAAGESLSPDDIDGLQGQLGALEAAIREAEQINFAFLQERLNVSVDLIADADIPESLRTLLANAQTGIDSTITFAVTADELTPELRWLALTQASEHLKTVEVVADNKLSSAVQTIALARSSDLARTVRLIGQSGMSTTLRRLALAGSSELQRTVNVILGSDVNQDAMRIALGSTGAYEVAVRAALDPSISDEVRQIVFGDTQTVTASITAALSSDIPDSVRNLLLRQQQRLMVNVAATLSPNINERLRPLILNANTNALREITIASAFAEGLTETQRRLLTESATTTLRTIEAYVNPIGWTADGLLFVRAFFENSSVRKDLIGGVTVAQSSADGLRLLRAQPGNVSRGVVGRAWINESASTDEGLLLLRHDPTATVSRVLMGRANINGLSATAQRLLRHLPTENVQRTITGSAFLAAITDPGMTLLLHRPAETIDRTMRGYSRLGAFTTGGWNLLRHRPDETVRRSMRGISLMGDFTQGGWDLLRHGGNEFVDRTLRGFARLGGLTDGAWRLLNLNPGTPDNVRRNLVGDSRLGALSDGAWRLLLMTPGVTSSVHRTLIGSVDLTALTDRQRALLDAINGSNSGNLTLGGTFTFDPTAAFQSWFGAETRGSFAIPMASLQTSLGDLRAAILQDIADRQAEQDRQQQISSLSSQLEEAVNNRNWIVGQANTVISGIHALEQSTGVDLRQGAGNETLRVNDDGTISYQASHVEYDPNRADIDRFSQIFWAQGGLSDQIIDLMGRSQSSKTQIERLRSQIIDLGAVPAFARGGNHRGGLARIAENDIEIVAPSRIYNPEDTRKMLDNQRVVDALMELMELMDRSQSRSEKQMKTLVRDTRRIAHFARKNDVVGLPPTREDA